MPGSALIFSRNSGAQWLSSPGSESASVYWYCVLFSRPPIVMQPEDHLVRARVALAFGLQRDEHAPGVGRVVAAAGANAGADRGDRWILQHGIDQRLLPLGHGLIRDVLRGF